MIGSALTGKLVSLYDYRMILVMLSIGIASMLIGMLLKPSVQPQGESRHQEAAGLSAWLTLVRQSWRFLACVCLLQGAHAAYYGFSAIYWQEAGYSAKTICQYFNKLLKYWLFDNLKLPAKTRPNSAGVDTLWITYQRQSLLQPV